MLIKGTEGFSPIQKKTTRPVSAAGTGRVQTRDAGYYDHYSLSAPAEQGSAGFRELVANLSYQVRTHNTTGKIQELRSQVSSGQYSIEPREIAARMLLLTEEGE